MTGLELLRELACDMYMVPIWATVRADTERKYDTNRGDRKTINDLLRAIADQIEAEQDERVTRRLEDREAAEWVREHGGLDAVKKLLGWVVGHCSTRQQLDFDFWLSGRVMHELGFDEDMADRDEVERRLLARLMPEGYEWPRYESGEPLRYEDRYVYDGREREVWHVDFDSCGEPTILNKDGTRFHPDKGERVERPAPKVLDADGVEIRVGDTVWVVGDAWPSMKVLEIQPDDDPDVPEHLVWCGEMCGEPLNDTKKWRIANQLTHRAPVIAADGRPLREGETVWDTLGNRRFKVLGFASDAKLGEFTVKTAGIDGMSLEGYSKPSDLTHERPVADTWERLERDAKAAVCVYFGVSDRDCGSCGHSSWECSYDKARDLVRRCKELARKENSNE